MKTPLAVGLVIVISIGAVAGFYFYNSSKPTNCIDPESISNHIYHPYRLQIVKPCITASGTVDRVLTEQDGDLHIRLNLDPAYSNLTNSANDEFQSGDLVVEIICVNTATQADAIPSCQDYTNHVPVPDVGQHITVTGPYVLDKEHGSWAEIHPVYSLVMGTSSGTTVNITSENLDISYPDGATEGWLGPSPRSFAAWHVVIVNPGDQFTSTLSLYSTSSYEEQISSIAVATPSFLTVSVSPNLPIIFRPEATVSITLTIQTPSSSYDGPIDIQIVTA